ncbi:MAG: PAS domain S-box protein, partial [Gemmatimonadales bacterium]
ILILEDIAADVELAERALAKARIEFESHWVYTQEDFVKALHEFAPDVVLADYHLPRFGAMAAIRTVKEQAPTTPVIVVTGAVGEEVAVKCIEAGAADYLLKDRLTRLGPAVRAALATKRSAEARRLVEETGEKRARVLRAAITSTQRSLWESQAQFKAVAESAPNAIVVADTDGRITFWNLAAQKIFGYTTTEVLGQPLATLIPERLRRSTLHGLARAVSAPGAPSPIGPIEVTGLDKHGREIPLELTLAHFTQGGRLFFVGVLLDITERKETEAKLYLQSAALEVAANAIAITDPRGTIQWINPAFTTLTGFPPEEAIGETFRILKSGKHDDSYYRDLWETILSGRTWRGELINRRKDGSLYHEEDTITPVKSQDGTITHFITIKQDITERKQSEEVLRESETKYRELVEHATYGIYHSSRDGRFLMVNPALVKMLGYESEEELLAVDMARDIYRNPADRAKLIAQQSGSERSAFREVEWKRRDGTPVTIQLSGRAVVNDSGEFQYFEGIAEDVTERRLLEAQLRQAQKMEAVGALTGGIAHDFNNLLSVILTNTQIMSESSADADGELQNLLSDIRAAAENGADMVRRLLGFSRTTPLTKDTVDLAQVVTAMSSMLQRLIPENVTVEVVADDPIKAVSADRAAVEQILLNLVTNARDAMPGGGTLTIAVSNTTVSSGLRAAFPWFVPGEYVLVAVTDTGTGMDEATRSRIFEPFFTTKPEGAGTGLGMAMVYGLMKQHGGFIQVESELGSGTTMKLYFPVGNREEVIHEHRVVARDVEDLAGDETILYVEDQDALLRAGTRVLERHGYTVIPAANGQEAIDIFGQRRSEIDLVICDLVMPELGGAQVLEALKEARLDIPFIMTTGYSANDTPDSLVSNLTVPILRKPWTMEELLRAVRDAVGKK